MPDPTPTPNSQSLLDAELERYKAEECRRFNSQLERERELRTRLLATLANPPAVANKPRLLAIAGARMRLKDVPDWSNAAEELIIDSLEAGAFIGEQWEPMRAMLKQERCYAAVPHWIRDAGIVDAGDWHDGENWPWTDGARIVASLIRQSVDAVRSAAHGAEAATLDGNDKATEPETNTIKPDPVAVHSADFTSVRWYGTEYTFALGVQSSAVEALWKEWKTTGLPLHQATIGKDAVDSERLTFRMDTAFRNNPAFSTMIQPCGDGKYKLATPAEQSAATTAPVKKKNRKSSKPLQKRV